MGRRILRQFFKPYLFSIKTIMKILHLVAIIVSMSFTFFVTSHAYAQCVYGSGINCSNYPPLNDLGDGNPFFMTVKGSFLPGQLVEISGNLVTVDPIQIILDNPQGMMKASKTTFSDRDGYFASELKIPADAEAGNWTIVGTSGIYHKELNFTILGNSDTVTCYAGNLCSKPIVNTTDQYGPKTTVSIAVKSPMEQFKSGINAQDVKCHEGLILVIKTTDGSPACVKQGTATKLVERGWAKMISETGVAINSYTPISNATENQVVKVVEIKMVPPYTPGGPVIQLTIQNVGAMPITHLDVTLETNHNYTFNFKSITSSTPLISGNSISDTTMLVGGGFQTESAYRLIINGMESNMPFGYIENVHIKG